MGSSYWLRNFLKSICYSSSSKRSKQHATKLKVAMSKLHKHLFGPFDFSANKKVGAKETTWAHLEIEIKGLFVASKIAMTIIIMVFILFRIKQWDLLDALGRGRTRRRRRKYMAIQSNNAFVAPARRDGKEGCCRLHLVKYSKEAKDAWEGGGSGPGNCWQLSHSIAHGVSHRFLSACENNPLSFQISLFIWITKPFVMIFFNQWNPLDSRTLRKKSRLGKNHYWSKMCRVVTFNDGVL